MARTPTTSDVFTAIFRRAKVSKHLKVLSEVGLVSCWADGRQRFYRLDPTRLKPMQDWLVKYQQLWNERFDRIDDYLKGLRQQGESP